MTALPTQIKLCLLGPPIIHDPSINSEIRIRSQKGTALLAYLVQKRTAVSRLELATLLWPDKPESKGRNNLSGELKRLTSALPGRFEASYQSIQFIPSDQITVDSWRLAESALLVNAWPNLLTAAVEHLRDGMPPADLSRFSGLEAWVSEGGVDQLLAQAQRYRGDFAAGLVLKNCNDFETWLINERNGLQRQIILIFQFLAAYYALIGDAQNSQQYSKRLLEIEPWREDGHQLLMLLYARQGEQKRALEQFAQCEAGLMMTPSSMTRKVHQLISSGQIAQWPDWQPRSFASQTGWPSSPYLGLDAFNEEDASFYFGREGLIAKLVQKICTQPLVALVGASGSGKSSVVMAGILPQLRQETDWTIVPLRLGADPFRALVSNLNQQVAVGWSEQQEAELADCLNLGELSLDAFLQEQVDLHSDLLLVIDQFEELFAPDHDQTVSERFVNLLFGLQPESVRVLLTLRADFMGQALHHWPLVEAFQSSLELIGTLSINELTDVIIKPAAQQGVTFEPGLVERILDDVTAEPEPLPLLEFALTALWQMEAANENPDLQLHHACYEAIGRVSGAITHHAEAVLTVLDPGQQQAAQRVFVQLVQPGVNTADTRRLAQKSDLSKAEWEMARYLADNRLVVMGRDSSGQETAEVAHEALIDSWISHQSWMIESRAFRLWQERLRQSITRWHATDQDDGALLRGVTLAEAEEWLAVQAGQFNLQEKYFVTQSLAARDAAQISAEAQRQQQLDQAQALAQAEHERAEIETRTSQRLRLFAAGLALSFVIAIVTVVIAFQQRQSARTAASLSQSLSLASRAQLVLAEGDSDLALALALQAYEIDNSAAQVGAVLTEAAYAPGTTRLFEGHAEKINRVTWNADETQVLSSAVDGKIILWDAQTGAPVFTLTMGDAFSDVAHDLAFAPNGASFFSVHADGQVAQWDVASGDLLQLFDLPSDVAGAMHAVAIDPTGQRLLAGGEAGQILLWEIGTGEMIGRYAGSEAAITALAFSPDGTQMLSGDDRNMVTYWELAQGIGQVADPMWVLEGHSQPVAQVGFFADGERAISSANDLLVWDLASGEITRQISTSGAIVSFALYPDERTIVAGLEPVGVRVFDLTSGDNLQQFVGTIGEIRSLALTADGRRLLSGSGSGEIRLLDLWSGAEVKRFTYPDLAGLLSLDVTADEQLAVIGSADGIVVTQPLKNGATPNMVQKSVDWLWGGMHILPNQKQAIFASGFRNEPPTGETLYLIDIDGGASAEIGSFTAGVSRLALSPEGNTALFSDLDGAVWVKALPNGLPRQIEIDDPAPAMGVAVGPDSSTGLVSFASGNIYHVDLESGDLLGQFAGSGAPVRALAISPDGRSALAGSFDNIVYRWDLTTYEIIQMLEGHQEFVSQLRFLPDGELALSTSVDKTMILWDLADGSILRQYTNFVGAPLDVRINRSGNHAYSVEDREAAILRSWRLDLTDEELLNWIEGNRYVPEFSCEQRELYNILPLCEP